MRHGVPARCRRWASRQAQWWRLQRFCIYDLLVLLRVNLFLDELTGRADWQNLITHFKASGYESLRKFVNLGNIKGAPLKIGIASLIGAVMGLIGGAMVWKVDGRQAATV